MVEIEYAKGCVMRDGLHRLVRKIAERNGSIRSYPLSSFVDDTAGVVLTCENRLFPETASKWLFSDVTDAESLVLLQAFMSDDIWCTYEIQRHLARLMATKGRLVHDEMEKIISEKDWSSYASPQQLLSYLAVMEDGANWIARLLNVVPNDARDGILTAGWYRNELCVQKTFYGKFVEWAKLPEWNDDACVRCWVEQYVARWRTEECFAPEDLARLCTGISSKRLYAAKDNEV